MAIVWGQVFDVERGSVVDRIEGFLPLREYAVLGDGRSCALVGSDGAIDWWALPTMADDPVFGALLDPARGGAIVVQPVGEFTPTRRYLEGSGVLETTFETASGTVRLTDALTISDGMPAWTELGRRIDGVKGEVVMTWRIAPGDCFGATAPWWRRHENTPLVTVGHQQFAIVSDAVGKPVLGISEASGTFTVRKGERALLALVVTDNGPLPLPSSGDIDARIDETVAFWKRWRDRIDYRGPWFDAVCRSTTVLRQLTLSSTGSLQAAATTSLPECIGGSRNFDYRFCWVRDAAFALDALINLGMRSEVQATLSALLDGVAATAPQLRPFYSMRRGAGSAQQHDVPLWQGYRGSAPVRKGNDASGQRQLGSYGDLLESVRRYAEHGNVLNGTTARMVARCADDVCDQWVRPDSGIWELPEEQHYTISKIACWAALDRAAALGRSGQIPGDHIERWNATAAEIHDYVDTACWSDDKRSYVFYAGSAELDAAALLAARIGFCKGDDPRMCSTIDAVRSELGAGGGLLYRYSSVRGKEGAFVACSFWLVEALIHTNCLDEAREVMDSMVALCNDVGLLSEEIDPVTHEFLGNFPQALSHLSLISAATAYGNATAT